MAHLNHRSQYIQLILFIYPLGNKEAQGEVMYLYDPIHTGCG